ncbi:tellurite resistance TerB family protein [Filomicrobium sp.]|uniref:tellurite resistance TerB family protein n=1 Tax=Filomicrobium sp. TaxID=2024831 RepID=UPI00258CC0AE|nr:tellurite resistance TerB family protein [Filomicrobium sp.]MCV0367811.1 tellurite resistance TerB family protein [Filomicrobium sp.]
MSQKISPQAALIYTMITTSAVDNLMSDPELRRIGWIVKELPVFRDFDETNLIEHAQACGKLMSGPDGLIATLETIASALPEHLRETAYALACEVAVTDDVVIEERRFLQLLRQHLHLDKLTTSAIERGALARHQPL